MLSSQVLTNHDTRSHFSTHDMWNFSLYLVQLVIVVITIPILCERNCTKNYNYDHVSTASQLCFPGLALAQANTLMYTCISSGKPSNHVSLHPDVRKTTTVLNLPIKYSQNNQITTLHTIDHEINKVVSMHAILKTLKATKVIGHLKPSNLLLYFVVLLLAQCNDIESNPGPSNDSTKYMCGTCDNTVTWEHRGIVCGTWDQWYHINCQNIHSKSYDLLNDRMVIWRCLICENPNYSTCAFDLHGISNSQ